MTEEGQEEPRGSGRRSQMLEEKMPNIYGELSHQMYNMNETLAQTLLNMSDVQQRELMGNLRNFIDGIYTRGVSHPLSGKDTTETLNTALRGASALMEPKPLDKEGAQDMVDALRKRYSVR